MKSKDLMKTQIFTFQSFWIRFTFKLILFLIGLIGFVHIASANEMCDHMGSNTTNIDMVVTGVDPQYDYSQTIQQITSLGGAYRINSNPNAMALGLTQSSFRDQLKGNFQSLRVAGGFCVRASMITLELGYIGIKVYVANAYAPGTCQQNTILNHENTHVSNATSTLDKYLPAFKYALDTQAQNQSKPVYAPDEQTGMNLILQNYKQAVANITSKMSAERQGLDSNLDSPQNYERTARLCSHW